MRYDGSNVGRAALGGDKGAADASGSPCWRQGHRREVEIEAGVSFTSTVAHGRDQVAWLGKNGCGVLVTYKNIIQK